MATARQIAARKEFARIMKSGGFGPRKAKARTARKRNPSGRTARDAYQTSSSSGTKTHLRTLSRAPRKRNPSGRSARDAYGNAWDIADGRVNNPRKRVRARPLRKNPEHARTRAPAGFAVHCASKSGERGKHIATFCSKVDAVQYGKAYVAMHNRPVMIVGMAR